MSENLPTVLLVVPTGSVKEYSLLQMLASIRNVDYPPDKLSLCFALTDREDAASFGFMERAKSLINCSNFPNNLTILKTSCNKEETDRWGQYYAVIKNLHEARKQFLDGDWEYMWLLGGDNPPYRDTLKRLLKADADIANAIVNQRPHRGGYKMVTENKETGVFTEGKDTVYPVYWRYSFMPEDVRKRTDLDSRVREAILQAWTNLCYFILVNDNKPSIKRGVSCGSGCQLVKREVLERCGWYMGGHGYHSEDIEFSQYAHLYGFDFAIDTGLHCRHFDPDGAIY